MIIYNPPEVLVIVDDPIVYDRNWNRLNDVCQIAIGIPFRNEHSEYGLHYNGWFPESYRDRTEVIWHQEACFLEVVSPSLVFTSNMERCNLLIEGRPSDWMFGQIRGSVVLYPINQWVKQILNNSQEHILFLNSQGDYEIIE